MNLDTLTILHRKLWGIHRNKQRQLSMLRQTPPGGDVMYQPPLGYTALAGDCKQFAKRIQELDALIEAESVYERDDKELDELAQQFMEPLELETDPQVRQQMHDSKISSMLMDCADYFAATLAVADPRAWEHLLVYAPPEIKEKLNQ
jgi:hypothetical protein